ncbi:MAG: hypothetical protein JO316_00505 [Abitibacteriaceae bacterium]|nr:hypothetical protein [Abditibacteriaceae bacterium]
MNPLLPALAWGRMVAILAAMLILLGMVALRLLEASRQNKTPDTPASDSPPKPH